MSLLCRLKNLVHKGILKEKDLERIVIIPKGQELCEDCISRKAVVEMLEGWWLGVPKEDLINEIENMPSIQPKPKTGHWIDITNKNGTVIAIRCDCCENSPKHAIRSDFCPNCGADMRESE